MKNYEKMSQDVLNRIHNYETEQKVRKAKMTKAVATVTPFCAAAVVGVGLWKGGLLTPENTPDMGNTIDSASEIATEATEVAKTTQQTEKGYVAIGGAGGTVAEDSGIVAGESVIISAEENSASESGDIAVEDMPVENESPQIAVTESPENSTETAVQNKPTEAVAPSENGNASGGENSFMLFINSIEWNGTAFYDSDMPNVSAYTRDRYIGKVGDFAGKYEDNLHYRINSDDSVYTVKETPDVLFVVKANEVNVWGEVVTMVSPAWSLEKYEPERLEPDYIDSDAVTFDELQVFNGCCQ